jgi:hypothetical protein
VPLFWTQLRFKNEATWERSRNIEKILFEVKALLTLDRNIFSNFKKTVKIFLF